MALITILVHNSCCCSGGRGFYLTNEGPLLNQALINAALHFAFKRGYKPVHTPFFMKQDIMAECAQLSQFDDELYKVTGKAVRRLRKTLLCLLHMLNSQQRAQNGSQYDDQL
jgi:seryl-tRNA synthetase